MFKRSIGVLVVCTFAILPACAMPNPMPSTTHDLPIVVTTGNELTPEQQEEINAALKNLAIELEKAEKEYAARQAVVASIPQQPAKKHKRHPFRQAYRFLWKTGTLVLVPMGGAAVGHLVGGPIGFIGGLAGWSSYWQADNALYEMHMEQIDNGDAK